MSTLGARNRHFTGRRSVFPTYFGGLFFDWSYPSPRLGIPLPNAGLYP